jgi:hypothetical protein
MSKKKLIIIKKNDEIDLHYNIRKVFIECLTPKNNKEFSLYEMYSNIFINILFLKCRYQEKTEKFIKNFLSKHKKTIMKNINFNINL